MVQLRSGYGRADEKYFGEVGGWIKFCGVRGCVRVEERNAVRSMWAAWRLQVVVGLFMAG